ncbi:glycoside hydrolase [Corynascus novoguineensis]|uniref:Glycoside hydrolase n=1 Tax=Corynascus novoguineensis TaxID=1126955 RepID=A0AAN7CSS0_9PEZI|nr:glycoside hydrolase [Corynascus novoguineensis]
MILKWAVVVASATAICAAKPWSSLPLSTKGGLSSDAGTEASPEYNVFQDMFIALSDMQDAYFENWLGTWPDGIDWTRAVMSTYVAATLRAISDELGLSRSAQGVECVTGKEEAIGGYFADIIAYYFAEDAFAIRNQAYDDMLWVVLGWLESIQFINEHSRLLSELSVLGSGTGTKAGSWYGSRWTPAFAHRARIFWELAAKGWDTKLCGGGMVWNPRLMPYKNAITNQLYISASISMYLHFPGDTNTSPFAIGPGPVAADRARAAADWPPHDPIFARAAQDAHAWLRSSNMTNAQGLYADGFHISGHNSGSNNTRCDERDEMVYTYNQGVLLSGLLGLYRATGREAYLREGHALVRSVISATGYDLNRNQPVDAVQPDSIPPWHGLGRAGVLEDACDALGTCSQDAQTFKGIWMHHFTAFCAPAALRSGVSVVLGSKRRTEQQEVGAIKVRHERECKRYIPWLRHNARAAKGTRDSNGLFGMWWTAGLLQLTNSEAIEKAGNISPLPPEEDGEVVDYRNSGVPLDPEWTPAAGGGQPPVLVAERFRQQTRTRARAEQRGVTSDEADVYDPNLRGRGRTVETQGGGLAVLRALWVVSKLQG